MKHPPHARDQVSGREGDRRFPVLVLILLVVLVAVAGAFLVWNGGDSSDVTPKPPELSLEDDPEAADPSDMKALGPVDLGPEEAEGELPEGLEEISREELPDAQANVRHLVLQVWDGKKGVPATAADVFFLGGFEGPELKDPFAQHWSTWAETRGLRYKTDVQGRVKLPSVQSWAMVTAQRPGAYGFAKVGPKHRDVETITLRPDETVTVRVVDGEDRTLAGVPVGVVQRIPVRENPAKIKELLEQMKMLAGYAAEVERYVKANPGERDAAAPKMKGIRERQARIKGAIGEQKGKRGKNGKGREAKARREKPKITTRVELRARRRTDSEGIAVFRHFQVYRHQQQKWWPPQHTDQFEAVLLMPLQRPESRAFAGRPVPTKTLELRLPATGSIGLRPVDHDGRPFTHPVQATLRMQGTKTVPWARVQGRKEQNDAVIVFPFVGLGLQFTAHCRLDDDDFRWSVPPFAGPSRPGERVTVDVVVAPGAGMLFGRLLTGEGKALAGARPTFLINSSAGRLEGEDITLDPEGRFHLPYQVRQQHRPPFRLEIRRNDVRPTAGLAMTLPALPAGQVTDLGDLRLDAFGRIAYGTVVDDRGQPIKGAVVQLQRERQVGGKQPRLAFVDEAFVVGRTDAEGQYELFAELEPGRYRLRAQARDHFPFESPDLVRGERADLELLRKSRVVGTVLTPAWMPSRRVRVRLELAADPKQRRDDQVHDHKGKKYVYFDWVRPGIYNVLIRMQDFPDPFLRVDGLEILPGQQGLHPRLKDLDLGAYLYRFEVAAVDERGKPIKPSGPLLARIARPGGQVGFVGFPWRGSKTEIFSVSPQLEVWPVASGYRAEHTVLPQGRSELRFLKVPPVELQVPGLRQLIGTMPAWLSMVLVSHTDLPARLETWDQRSGRIAGWYGKGRSRNFARLGKDDSVQMTLTYDGRYQVFAYMGDKSKGISPVRVEFGAVDVRLVAGAGPLRVRVNVDTERVQAGLAEVARRRAAK